MRKRTTVCTTLDGSQNMRALRRYIHVHVYILFDPTGLAGLVSQAILLDSSGQCAYIHTYVHVFVKMMVKVVL